MPTEWIDISASLIDLLDTVAKISLGAIISGVVTYNVTKENHKSENNKFKSDKRIDILEEITSNADSYFHNSGNLIGLANGARFAHPDLIELNNHDDEQSVTSWKAIDDSDDIWVKSDEYFSYASSRVKILKIDKAAVILSEHFNLMEAFREQLIFKNTLPSTEEINKVGEQHNIFEDDFYEIMVTEYGLSDI